MKISWHSISWKEAVKELSSNAESGLTEKGAKLLLEKFGPNKLPDEKPLSNLAIFLEQFKSPLIYILLIAGIVVLIFKEFTDAIVIFSAVLLNTTVGFFQESKATTALGKLKKIVTIEAKVVREGNIRIINSEHLAPGDIFILSPGDKVPADGRLIDCDNLMINEMALTGEWLSDHKETGVLAEATSLADRDNMVYMGTVVEDGKARVLCVATGKHTELGKVAQMVRETKEEKTPIQKKLSRLAKIVGIVIIFLCIIIFTEGLLTGKTFLEIFGISVAVAVAAIPEGLPVAMTVILALGMQRILKKRGLVRRLSSAETLGSTSIIATDKTGTLTEGKMQVAEIIAETKADRNFALRVAALCNEAFIENPGESLEKWIARGRPTDRALLLAGVQAGINIKNLEKKMPQIAELPFNTNRKYLARAFSINRKEDVVYLVGAPEKLLEMSKYLNKGKKQILLSPELKKDIEKKLEKLAAKGLRVVAVAYKKINNLRDHFENLCFIGLIALKDPVRKEAKRAIKICQKSGMRPIIVTGDHKLTAIAVAKEIGLKVGKGNVMEGRELDKLSDREFDKKIEDIKIYARVEPRHKMRIISSWQERGEVIAMTGDGINDAPALKRADIGIALGSGTEVAKEVSDLVLLTDNFNIIVASIEEGRGIIDNIRKVITYLLSNSFTEIILVGVSILAGFPLPVTAVQILWVNLIGDGLPSIALAFEPKEKNLMEQKPEGHNILLLTKQMKTLIFLIGIITDLLLLTLFFLLLKFSNYDIFHIRTMIFAGLAINSLFYIFSCKSLRQNIWNINIFSNKFLVFSWAFGVLALLMAVYLLPFQTLLGTVSLSFFDWIIILGLGFANLALIEFTKWIFIRKSYKHLNI